MKRMLPLVLVGLSLAPSATAQDTSGVLEKKVELVIVQEDGRTKGLSVSFARGVNVETAAVATQGRIATGAIASMDPVHKHEDGDGFDLYTSPVGPAAQ